MKINIINGSQKMGESNSGIILDRLNSLIKQTHEVNIYNCGKKPLSNEIYEKIISGDVIILAFPLFVHSLPSNTIKMLIELENILKQKQINKIIMYTIINNGFYEGKQNNIAFEIIKHWCEHSGVEFGGRIGLGAGEMVGQTKNIPINKGPFNNLERALQKMVESIELKKSMEIIFLSPYFPRFLWKFMATRYWNKLAKNNGLIKKDITRKL
jgi:multimeric flavodoxin WrbA